MRYVIIEDIQAKTYIMYTFSDDTMPLCGGNLRALEFSSRAKANKYIKDNQLEVQDETETETN